MTQAEIDLIFKRDAQMRSKKKEPDVTRGTSLNKIVNFTVNETVFDTFKELVVANGYTVPMILRAAIISYAFGDLKLDNGRLVAINESHTTFHVEPKRPIGRPAISKPVESHKPSNDWYAQDHTTKPLSEYVMPPEPHLHVDPRQHLQWDTFGHVTQKTFEDFCDDLYMEERRITTNRKWETGGLQQFVSRVALKFFAINKIENLRYDEDTLQEGMYKLRDDNQTFVEIGYKEGYIKDEDPQ